MGRLPLPKAGGLQSLPAKGSLIQSTFPPSSSTCWPRAGHRRPSGQDPRGSVSPSGPGRDGEGPILEPSELSGATMSSAITGGFSKEPRLCPRLSRCFVQN